MRIPVSAQRELEHDPLLRAFCQLRDRELRAHTEETGDGLFVAEGEVVLRVLLATTRWRIRAVLLSEQAEGRILPLVPEALPTYVAPLPLMQAIVGFPIHRGVLAVAERGPEASPSGLLAPAVPLTAEGGTRRASQLVVGLCGLTNHDNVGGVFRNAAAFGAYAALLDRATCDPLYRKALRVSVGGTLVVPYAFVPDERAVVEALLEAGHEVLALSPRGERVIGHDPPPAGGRTALLVGAEGRGLSEETLARCSTARIPMHGCWDSLNVAVASGIALAWLRSTPAG